MDIIGTQNCTLLILDYAFVRRNAVKCPNNVHGHLHKFITREYYFLLSFFMDVDIIRTWTLFGHFTVADRLIALCETDPCRCTRPFVLIIVMSDVDISGRSWLGRELIFIKFINMKIIISHFVLIFLLSL